MSDNIKVQGGSLDLAIMEEVHIANLGFAWEKDGKIKEGMINVRIEESGERHYDLDELMEELGSWDEADKIIAFIDEEVLV